MAANKLTMKLWIDHKGKRVLFAEAGKDLVDVLFSLLSLPIGSVISLLTKDNMVGSIANLYQSVKNLDDTYVLNPKTNKEILLEPQVAASIPLNVPLLVTSTVSPVPVYSCSSGYHHSRYSNDPKLLCPHCRNYTMSLQLTFVPPAASSGGVKGYVKETVTYMVMDDLSVTPISTSSTFDLLKKLNVEDFNFVEERVVDFGMDKCLQLLKTSLQSKNVLSQVFHWEELKTRMLAASSSLY